MTALASRLSARSRLIGWWLAALFSVAYLATMAYTGALPRSRQLVQTHADGLLAVEPGQVQQVDLMSGNGVSLSFERADGRWIRQHDGITLTAPQVSTLERAVQFMHTSPPVREFDHPSASASAGQTDQYGLDKPVLTLSLRSTDGAVLQARFGALNADGFLQYVQVDGRPTLFLLSRFVGTEWQAVVEAVTR